MTLPDVFRDDDVERPADGFRRAETEDPLGALVPQPDPAFGVGIDNRIRRLVNQSPAEQIAIEVQDAPLDPWCRPLLSPRRLPDC